jgi:transposase
LFAARGLAAERELAVDHGAAQRAFGVIVGRLDPGSLGERPQRRPGLEQGGVPPVSWTLMRWARWALCERMVLMPYSPDFRREAVALLRSSGKTVPQIAAELGVSPQSLRNWAHQSKVDDGPAEGLTSSEREELRRLRRELRVVTEEREILKKAAAFFAKESATR